jgi:hopene-associated glycosyltransferase HpnB
VIAGRPLEPGWTGKLWAVQQGIGQALRLRPGYLLLTGADIRHDPNNLAALLSVAQSGNYDLTSFMVKLRCRSVAEHLLIPAFVFFFFMLYPPRWIRDRRRSTSGAAGGCILIRPEALARAGGIASIRSEIIDDCSLARTVKSSGGRVWLGLTTEACSLRVYDSFAEIERMIARTAFNQLRHSALLLGASLLGLTLLYLLPVALVCSGSPMLLLIGIALWLLMAIAYLPMVRFYGLPPLWAFSLPLSAAFYMAATVHSAWKYWSGRGGEWKGRAQDAVTSDKAHVQTTADPKL